MTVSVNLRELGVIPNSRARARLVRGLVALDEQRPELTRLRQYWRGNQPAAFLSKESRDALDKRLTRLGTNFPRLVVSSLAERLALAAFTLAADDLRGTAATALNREFLAAGGRELAEQVHVDRLLYGSAYVTVWADEGGAPTLTGDGPLTMTHGTDPATGATLWALRVWATEGETGSAVLYEPEQITFWETDAYSAGAQANWRSTGELDNPLDAVPVVPLVRRVSLSDPRYGASAIADVLDLSDAVAKLLSDAMVTSEFYVRPRRWATGLEIQEDDDGKAVDPFGASRLLQSEDPETKFGQLDGSRLDGYGDLIATMTQQIGALTGLPAHYLGLHGDQPPNADSVRAAEAQLTSRAYTEISSLTRPWATVAWLLDAVREQGPAEPTERAGYGATWDSPEIRTPAQAADVAVKLRSIGVPLADVLADPMGYGPERVATIVAAADRQAVIDAVASRGR